MERLNPIVHIRHEEASRSSVELNFNDMTILFESIYLDYPGSYFRSLCDLASARADENEQKWFYKQKAISYSGDEDGSFASNISPNEYYFLRLSKLEEQQKESFSHLVELQIEEITETVHEIDKWKEVRESDLLKEINDKFCLLKDSERNSVFTMSKRNLRV